MGRVEAHVDFRGSGDFSKSKRSTMITAPAGVGEAVVGQDGVGDAVVCVIAARRVARARVDLPVFDIGL